MHAERVRERERETHTERDRDSGNANESTLLHSLADNGQLTRDMYQTTKTEKETDKTDKSRSPSHAPDHLDPKGWG